MPWVKLLLKRHGLWPTVAVATLVAVAASAAISATVHYPILGIGMTPVAWLITIACPLLIAPPMSGVTLHLVRELDRAHEKLQRINDSDHLTGLYNRRYFMQRLQHEIERSRRYRTLYSVAFIDVDDFKPINDRYGHLGGDDVLKRLADACAACVREPDTLARIGGEEFAVLMPETGRTEALTLLERLRSRVDALRVPQEGEIVQVTISVGLTSPDAEASDLSSVLRCADRALYEAKRLGKNRVAVDSPRNAAVATEPEATGATGV
ncbi:MAG: GGDEF domain-containing protein [Ectothiorhodospiraceae bacterium]